MSLVDTHNLSLFGLDLNRVIAFVRLGVSQLLWGDQARLCSRFYPPAHLVGAQAPCIDCQQGGIFYVDPDAAVVTAVGVSDDELLVRSLQLPEQAEVYLQEAIALEVSSNSPFPSPETVHGHKVIAREAGVLTVVIALTSRVAVGRSLLSAQLANNDASEQPEVWAMTSDYGPVLLEGFGEGIRRGQYLASIKRLLGLGVVLWACLIGLLWLPAWYTQGHAEVLQVAFDEVSLDARRANMLREQLESQRALLDSAVKFGSGRTPYRFWLHELARLTPDSVYLSRVEFDGNKASLSGLALNAADYLGLLAESNRFESLEAPSAFTRERTTGREKFTIEVTFAKAPNDA